MGNPEYGKLLPSESTGTPEDSQRFDDEKEAEAYAASVSTAARPYRMVAQLLVKAYLAGLKRERER